MRREANDRFTMDDLAQAAPGTGDVLRMEAGHTFELPFCVNSANKDVILSANDAYEAKIELYGPC